MKIFVLNKNNGELVGLYPTQRQADKADVRLNGVSTRTTEVNYKPPFQMTPQKERLLNRLRNEDVYAFDDFGTLSENGKAIEEEPWGAIEYLLDCLEQERG